ncbi:hypothetical protein C5167_031570 [Papaver somniferum]|uniref:Uncharacterized protein n=1 Tax=Papaver somniferum TaxID=3469 RepID=A0A4Y7K8H6_PAPSO|nr:hypothetical protein C5167_031570 [Papaver somniferum]
MQVHTNLLKSDLVGVWVCCSGSSVVPSAVELAYIKSVKEKDYYSRYFILM